MLYFCTNVMITKDWISLSPNAIKDAPHIVREVDLKGGIGEALKTVGIGITFGVVASLNATPERSNSTLDSVIPLHSQWHCETL